MRSKRQRRRAKARRTGKPLKSSRNKPGTVPGYPLPETTK